jgi:hypothetical protein
MRRFALITILVAALLPGGVGAGLAATAPPRPDKPPQAAQATQPVAPARPVVQPPPAPPPPPAAKKPPAKKAVVKKPVKKPAPVHHATPKPAPKPKPVPKAVPAAPQPVFSTPSASSGKKTHITGVVLIGFLVIALFAVGLSAVPTDLIRPVGVARVIAQRRAGTAVIGAGVAIAIAAAYVLTKVGG